MVDRLFVIIGAGASYACTPASVPHDPDYWPPLTADLFSTSNQSPRTRLGFTSTLAEYPLAKAAAAELSTAKSAVSLETTLRDQYRDSLHEHDKRIFTGVLPYLQELLHSVTYKFTSFPQNYEVLVTKLMRLQETIFISLNYDLLLDNVLLTFDPARSSMAWYLGRPRNWSLIKLHGSVNWGRRLISSAGLDDFFAPRAELRLLEEIMLRPQKELFSIRGFTSDSGVNQGELYFPALAAPVGESDELVCPPQHVRFLQERLSETQPMHLLVIGYSGIDREVVRLIRESERGVKTLSVVDRNFEGASDVVSRLAEQGVGAADVKPYDGSFDGWVHGGGLDAFVKEMTYEPF